MKERKALDLRPNLMMCQTLPKEYRLKKDLLPPNISAS